MNAFAGESGETVYEPEVPHIKTEKTSTTHKSTPTKHHSTSNNPKAEGSAATGGTGESSGEPEKSESGSEHKKSSGGAAANGGNNNPPKGGGGEGGGNAKGSTQEGVSPAKKVSSPVHTSKSSGGSSPVVPILIAVAVLAAISIGVVLYRQRKSGQGPDSRISSPNAS